MDANRIAKIEGMKEFIAVGLYEITGILETGEIVIALLSDIEKEYLDKVFTMNKSKSRKLFCVQSLRNVLGRPANELVQVYKQKTCKKVERSFKNGLRLR